MTSSLLTAKATPAEDWVEMPCGLIVPEDVARQRRRPHLYGCMQAVVNPERPACGN